MLLRAGGPAAFAFPFALACLTGQALGAGALAFVSATTFWVHRDLATPRYGLREKADHCAILLWAVHNAAVTLACASKALEPGKSAWRLAAALVLAACALGLARARLAFAYRDPRRVLCRGGHLPPAPARLLRRLRDGVAFGLEWYFKMGLRVCVWDSI